LEKAENPVSNASCWNAASKLFRKPGFGYGVTASILLVLVVDVGFFAGLP